MQDAFVIERIRRKFTTMAPVLDERARRQWAAAEALELAWGGVTSVAAATGLSRTTIAAGIADLERQADGAAPTPRIRRPGGGRKHLMDTDQTLSQAVDAVIEPLTRGDPESPLRWTCKSTRRLAAELTGQGHPISDRTVAAVLVELGYSLQANRKTREGGQHPHRKAQFEYINTHVRPLHNPGHPAPSLDTNNNPLPADFPTPAHAT